MAVGENRLKFAIMKKILLSVALALISVIAFGQNEVFENELIRFCRYEKAYLKSDNTGIIGFSNFEVLYDKRNSIYGVQVHVAEGTKFDFILKYDKTLREGKDVLYIYEGYRKISKERSVVLTRTKLSSYTNNSGFSSKETITETDWDKQTIMFTLPESFTVFSVAPIKDR